MTVYEKNKDVKGMVNGKAQWNYVQVLSLKIRISYRRKNIGYALLTVWIVITATSCDNGLETLLEFAKENRNELDAVLAYFDEDTDELKKKSAHFLIRNMYPHHTQKSEAVDSFTKRMLMNLDSLTTPVLRKWWAAYKDLDNPQKEFDVQNIKADFLIDNIERAVDIWNKSLWKAEVSENLFISHILPYRFLDETLAPTG